MSTDDLIRAMNAYYDHRAPWHDEYMSYSGPERMQKLLAPIIDLFDHHIKDRDILEIACGTGNWTVLLTRMARSVTAIDINRSVLDIAKSKLGEYPNVTLQEIDAYAVGELDGTFDLAFAADWYSHIPISMVAPFLGSLHKRLRSGGRVIFIDMLWQPIFDEDKTYIDDEGNRVWLRSVPDGSAFPVIKNFPTEAELLRAVENAAEEIEYYRHEELKRWVLTYTLKS